ncbi:unnamed protein product [Caenorhabditis auriculariae]|uniref:C2H2-type domain-containing protein n=1 Tax=Caenorhabditis auriculariae TaxID=2777116 RepID=A0A8S1HJU4_9PELO|nr:unnamed protein product [Caenorhabditis auriculariae]
MLEKDENGQSGMSFSIEPDSQGPSSSSPLSESSSPPNLQEILQNLSMSNPNGVPMMQNFMPPQNPLAMPPLAFNPFLMLNPMINHQLLQQVLAAMTLNSGLAGSSSSLEEPPKVRRDHRFEMKKSASLDCDDAPYDNMGDVIIPSSDKEGWCRNKKYIEKTETGFMCTVCKKVYGRYNSVSYHVTIYHRNPPIRCTMPNCQFTTREARYIHFHKYYRHGIPLPQSIDQGSRKCPHCRHVSKSPAMLEKHIRRHQIKEESQEEMTEAANVLAVDEEMDSRDRTVSICDEPMDEDVDVDVVETKPRSSTL